MIHQCLFKTLQWNVATLLLRAARCSLKKKTVYKNGRRKFNPLGMKACFAGAGKEKACCMSQSSCQTGQMNAIYSPSAVLLPLLKTPSLNGSEKAARSLQLRSCCSRYIRTAKTINMTYQTIWIRVIIFKKSTIVGQCSMDNFSYGISKSIFKTFWQVVCSKVH